MSDTYNSDKRYVILPPGFFKADFFKAAGQKRLADWAYDESMKFFFLQFLSERREWLGEATKPNQQQAEKFADDMDKAAYLTAMQESESLRRKHLVEIKNIDAAIARIHRGDFGYSEESGEALKIKRLLLVPTATLTPDEQEKQDFRRRIGCPREPMFA